MGPIACAARQFFAEMEAFWEAWQARAMRMVVSDEDRNELVKALRVAELSPENRWPMFLYEAPFTEPHSYFNGLCDRIAQDYELIRKGAAEEGVTLAPFAGDVNRSIEGFGPAERAAAFIEHAAALLGERLDGALIALVPAHVAAPARWQESIATLATAPFSQRVRFAITDQPGGPLEPVLGAEGARFTIDKAKRAAYAKRLAEGARGGQAPHEQATPDRRRALGPLLIDAAERTRQGDSNGAAVLYRRAISLCQGEDLTIEEACIRMALAGACLAVGDGPAALENYQKAAELGKAQEAFPIVCQARLGAGGVCFAFTRYEHAGEFYEMAAEAAEQAKIPLLRIEALRMAGTCHVLRGSKEDALIAWATAMNAGIAMKRPARQVSTLEQAAEGLRDLLMEVGLIQHAADVERYLQTVSAERRESACS